MRSQAKQIDVSGKIRRRRRHRNSRAGCGNCKLRGIKCDEQFPECANCLSYGVCCNYDPGVEDLQPRSACISLLEGYKPLQRTVLRSASSPESSEIELTNAHLGRFRRFKIRTILSIPPLAGAQLLKEEIFRLAFRHPFLMHLTQSLTAIHDRSLSPDPDRRTIDEIRSWTRGVTLFNKTLSTTPLHPADRDAIWAAATILGVITFASIETKTLENTWPLARTTEAEPEWIKMSMGKSVLWNMVQPDRPESIFCNSISVMPKPGISLQNVPSELLAFYNLNECSVDNNPYAIPLSGIFCSPIHNGPPPTITVFYAIISSIEGEFGRLLRAKELPALLAMVYWYSKLCTGEWWLRRRAVVEGQATCLYLQRFARHNAAIQDLLTIPRHILFETDL